jgi:hypothetical protein
MRIILLTALSSLLFISSCKKDENTSEPKPGENTSYINTHSGSSWVYHEINASGATSVESDYTVTSTSRDTTISNRSYHIYNVSFGGNRFLNLSGKEYYEFDTIPGGGSKTFQRLYLKTGATPGSNWTQSETIEVQGVQIPVKITNTIVENSLTRMVNGKNYQNVIHVSTKITSDLIPGTALTTEIHSYYAPNYGLIENTSKLNLNYLGIVEKLDITTTLKSSDLK